MPDFFVEMSDVFAEKSEVFAEMSVVFARKSDVLRGMFGEMALKVHLPECPSVVSRRKDV